MAFPEHTNLYTIWNPSYFYDYLYLFMYLHKVTHIYTFLLWFCHLYGIFLCKSFMIWFVHFPFYTFSGGCWHNEMCGGLSSSLAVLGILYSRDGHGHDSPELKKMAFELFSRFEEKFGNGKCWRLKKAYYVPERKCEVLLVHIADILEDIIAKNEIINK